MYSAICKLLGHSYTSWAPIEDGLCIHIRRCKRCPGYETRHVPHKYGELIYRSEDSCLTIRKCINCGQEEEGKVCHEFSNWEYENENSCKKIRYCIRDLKKEEKEVHDFGPWMDNKNQDKKIQTCKRCGKINEREIVKVSSYSYSSSYTDDNDFYSQRDDSYDSGGLCRLCGGRRYWDEGKSSKGDIYPCPECNPDG